MTRRHRTSPASGTGALIFGIILTVMGGALVVERIIGQPVWDYLWRLWPLLLVAMGAKILLDYYAGPSRREGKP